MDLLDVMHATWTSSNDLLVTACGEKWRQGTSTGDIRSSYDKTLTTCAACIEMLKAADLML